MSKDNAPISPLQSDSFRVQVMLPTTRCRQMQRRQTLLDGATVDKVEDYARAHGVSLSCALRDLVGKGLGYV